MTTAITGLVIGFLFGGGLFLAGLADPDKIIGTLRLKDFHAMRVIALFVIVGMVGVWVLDLAGVGNFSVKSAAVVGVLIGGGLLGIGFGLTGYCPGTGLACAAAGRLDAAVSIAGMLAGALVFILIYPDIAEPVDRLANYGKVMLPEITGMPRAAWVLVFAGVGSAALVLTRPGRRKAA